MDPALHNKEEILQRIQELTDRLEFHSQPEHPLAIEQKMEYGNEIRTLEKYIEDKWQ